MGPVRMETSSYRGLIAAFVNNPVLANLLAAGTILAGIMAAYQLPRETFPETAVNYLYITTLYPGAGPLEVEKSITIPIEQAIEGIPSLWEISSTSEENRSMVGAFFDPVVTPTAEILRQVQGRVHAVSDLPPGAHRPIVEEGILRNAVITLGLHGNAPELTIKRVAEKLRDELFALPQVSQLSLFGVRGQEISVRVDPRRLEEYGLSLQQIVEAVAAGTADAPAGTLRSRGEEIHLRTSGGKHTADELRELSVVARPDGSRLRLRDLATVADSFAQAPLFARVQGEPGAILYVNKTATEDISTVAVAVREFVIGARADLPEGLHLSILSDKSRDVDARVNMLIWNGVVGIVLLMICLFLFMDFRAAVGVAMGLPVAMAGALVVMWMTGQTLNLISLFGLIMADAIVLDDSIVIADSVLARERKGLTPALAAIQGTSRVASPVIHSSLTTTIMFLPLLFVEGAMGKLIYVLPVVVIASIAASLAEAFFILPAHLCEWKNVGRRLGRGARRSEADPDSPLAGKGPEPTGSSLHPGPQEPGEKATPMENRKSEISNNEMRSDRANTQSEVRYTTRVRMALDRWIELGITRGYRPLVQRLIRNRLIVLAGSAAVAMVCVGLVVGGRTPFVLFPKLDCNTVRARVRFPEGTPIGVTEKTVLKLEQDARALNEDPVLKPFREGLLVQHVHSASGAWVDFLPRPGSNLGEVTIELMPAEDRRIDVTAVMDRWRARIGEIPLAESVVISREELGPNEKPIEIQLRGEDLGPLRAAADELKARLADFAGVFGVEDDLPPGKRELRVSLTSTAGEVGLTAADLARQLRTAVHGGEAARIQTSESDKKIMVSLDDESTARTSLDHVLIRTPLGFSVPLSQLAETETVRGYSGIGRKDGQRRIRVQADLDEQHANAERVLQELERSFLPDLPRRFPGVSFNIDGQRKRIVESLESLWKAAFVALIATYVVLGAALRSYVEPLILMAAVPLGLAGAVLGHFLLGFDLSLMSVFGMTSVAGIVVNDALVLLDEIHRNLGAGVNVRDAVARGAETRVIAVFLTAVTNVAGMAPLLLERSTQAVPLIPIAISVAFGLCFAMALTLLVVPALYLAVNDVRRLVHWFRFGGAFPAPEQVEPSLFNVVARAE